MEGSQHDHLTYDELHNVSMSRGYGAKDAKKVSRTCLEVMDSVEKISPQVQLDNEDTSFSVLGKRARSLSVSHILGNPTRVSAGKRVRREPAASSMTADLDVVRKHAHWWSSDLKPQLAVLFHHMVEGSDEAVNVRELEAWKMFKVFSPVQESDILKTVIDSRWALTWKMVDGVMKEKARLVAKGFQDPDLTE